MRFKRESPEVFFATGPLMSFGRDDLEDLKAQALSNSSGKARVCAHPSVEDMLHEMLIVHGRNAYVHPHKHIGRSESFHMIEGGMTVVVFDEDGGVYEALEMAAVPALEGALYYRLSESLFHTVIPRSEVVVFHETTNGPFDRTRSVFAPWAPKSDDQPAIEVYWHSLEEKLRDFARRQEGIAGRRG